MHIKILSVGRSHNDTLSPAIAEYEKRLRKHVVLSWDIIPPSTVANESAALLRHASDAYVILLDEAGMQPNNKVFAEEIEDLRNNSTKQLVFIIGGAYGVDTHVKTRADRIWSLSQLVFPHQLVRLLLVEQLYRSYDFLAGGKYHHA